MSKKNIIISILAFLLLVFILEIFTIDAEKKDPKIDNKLLLIIEKNSELNQKMGSMRSSKINYYYIQDDTLKFDGHFSGNQGKLNFSGNATRSGEQWKLLNYSIVKDSL